MVQTVGVPFKFILSLRGPHHWHVWNLSNFLPLQHQFATLLTKTVSTLTSFLLDQEDCLTFSVKCVTLPTWKHVSTPDLTTQGTSIFCNFPPYCLAGTSSSDGYDRYSAPCAMCLSGTYSNSYGLSPQPYHLMNVDLQVTRKNKTFVLFSVFRDNLLKTL